MIELINEDYAGKATKNCTNGQICVLKFLPSNAITG